MWRYDQAETKLAILFTRAAFSLRHAVLSVRHGGIPILFPFAGKCYHEGQADKWSPAANSTRSMPTHGFAKDADFLIRSIDQSGFEVEMIQNENDRNTYPFEYTFTVIYHFLELSLQISLVLENGSLIQVLAILFVE